jgi:signal transduction histidine kinase
MEKWVPRKPARPVPRARSVVAGRRLLDRGPPAAQMVAVVGHEIRAPLAAALLYMKIVERHLVPGVAAASARTALATARDELMRAERLCGRVIELQKLGHPVLRPHFLDIGEVVRQTVRRSLLGDVAAQVTLEAAPGTLLDWWDEGAVEQILQNLLSNAIKFGAGRPIMVAVGPVTGGARIVVRDQGIGISAADRERIFRRAVHAPVDRAGGLGLGLWLVKELSEAHGGKVAVRSRPRRGSTFTVTLRPVRPVLSGANQAALPSGPPTTLSRTLQTLPQKAAQAV